VVVVVVESARSLYLQHGTQKGWRLAKGVMAPLAPCFVFAPVFCSIQGHGLCPLSWGYLL